MRSIKTTVTAAAFLTAGFVLTAPAAHAAAAPHGACPAAMADAHMCEGMGDSAQSGDDSSQSSDDQSQSTGGWSKSSDGSGKSKGGWSKSSDDSSKGDDWGKSSDDWGKGHGWEHHRRHCRHPHGAMHTGVGSTSQGTNGGEIAGGLGLLGAAGLGGLALRRRRAGSEG